jgi:hypothetical protein
LLENKRYFTPRGKTWGEWFSDLTRSKESEARDCGDYLAILSKLFELFPVIIGREDLEDLAGQTNPQPLQQLLAMITGDVNGRYKSSPCRFHTQLKDLMGLVGDNSMELFSRTSPRIIELNAIVAERDSEIGKLLGRLDTALTNLGKATETIGGFDERIRKVEQSQKKNQHQQQDAEPPRPR